MKNNIIVGILLILVVVLGALTLYGYSPRVRAALSDGTISFGTKRLINLGAPTAMTSDAATTSWVASQISAAGSALAPSQIDSINRGPDSIENAAKTCRLLGSGWHLPSAEEAVAFSDPADNSLNLTFWTRTFWANQQMFLVNLKNTDASIHTTYDVGQPSGRYQAYYRCVK